MIARERGADTGCCLRSSLLLSYSKSRVRWRPTRHSINRAGDGFDLNQTNAAEIAVSCPARSKTNGVRMRILAAYIAVVLSASMSASIGSPCSQDIDQVQAKIDAHARSPGCCRRLRPREHGSHHASSTDTALDCRRRGPAWEYITRATDGSRGAHDRRPRGSLTQLACPRLAVKWAA
jgi:hypothetical protein